MTTSEPSLSRFFRLLYEAVHEEAEAQEGPVTCKALAPAPADSCDFIGGASRGKTTSPERAFLGS